MRPKGTTLQDCPKVIFDILDAIYHHADAQPDLEEN